ncbi:MAG: hypothetical protein JOZ74_03455 [Bradyrhizobium sp.]|nr:hypothetical protein [Bradyrhizobium sp.]
MTEGERRNERRKLVANWFNTVATAIMTVGSFVPLAQFVYGILPANVDLLLVYGSGLICVGCGTLLHLMGHMVLGGLE